jgi:hypothetical protein
MLLVLAWSAVRVHYLDGGNWTALFCVGARVSMPAELNAKTYRVPYDGYDGQFYRLLAHDPFLGRHYARYADAPQFRFRRYLVPFLAWGIALGQQGWVDGAYIAVEMLFIALGVYWCARLCVRGGRSPLWGLMFLALPATLASFDRMLVDGPLAALFAGFLLYCDEERWERVWLVAALAALTRETGLLFSAALIGDRLWRYDWRGAARYVTCAIPALAWYAVLAARLPSNKSISEIGFPVWVWLQRLLVFRSYSTALGQLVLRATDLLAVAGLIASVVLAAFWLRKGPSAPVTICVGLYACLALVLGAPVMEDPFAFGRVITPLLLWIMVEAVARRKLLALAPPLLVSLSVSLVFVLPLIAIAQALSGR